MKNLPVLLTLGTVAFGSATLHASIVYPDATGDLAATFSGNTNLDISSVTVSHDATTVSFRVQTVGAADWTKFNLFINTDGSGPVDTINNPWNRDVTNSVGANIFVGSWIDGGGGAQLFTYSGGAWSGADSANISLSITNFGDVTYTINLAALGNPSSLGFDVGTSGGGDGDPWVDALSLSGEAVQDWGGQTATGAFAIYAVPEPSTYALGFGLLALLIVARRRMR